MNNKKTLSLENTPGGHVIAISDGTRTAPFTNRMDGIIEFAKLIKEHFGSVSVKNSVSAFDEILVLGIPKTGPDKDPEKYDNLVEMVSYANKLHLLGEPSLESGIPEFLMDPMRSGYGIIFCNTGIMEGLSSKREARESVQKLCDECRFDKQHLKGLLEQIDKTPEETFPEDSITSCFNKAIAEKLAKGDYVVVTLDGPTGNDPF